MACEQNLFLSYFDIKQAFVQSDLDADVFMRLPEGCGRLSGMIVKLNKSLYGLKQASRQWHSHLARCLICLGLIQCMVDTCVFRLIEEGRVVVTLVVHVDDIFSIGEEERCDQFGRDLNTMVPVKNLGDLRWYSGCFYERDWDAGTLKISQQTYAEELGMEFGVEYGKEIPLPVGLKLSEFDQDEEVVSWPFRELIGSLMWLATQTRPDIANAVRAVARYCASPKEIHWRAGLGILGVFVDLGGRKDVASVGGKHYPMIVKDDFTRRAWMYFLKHKSDAGMAFRSFLASVRADGVPSLVEIVRSDNGGEFFGGEFASVCNELLIKQEFTPAYSPQYNGVAERGLGLIEEAAMAARIQAKVLFGHVQLPKTDKLWAEAMHWACEAMNHTACSANPDSKSPYEMWRSECKARFVPHPSQTGQPETTEGDSGEQSVGARLYDRITRTQNSIAALSEDADRKLDAAVMHAYFARSHKVFIVSACEWLTNMMYDVSGLKCLLTSRDDLVMSAVSNDMILNAVNKSRYVEDWYADTGTAFHMTDSLACMKDLKPCHKSVNGIGGVSCEISFSGTLELVFVTADSEFSMELKNVLYSPNLGYNLFSPSAEFDGESWNGLGGPDGVMTAFKGQVTFQNFDGMLIASAYRLGEASVGTVLAALTPSNPKHKTTMDVNEFHNIYAHSHKGLLRTTAKRLGTELVGEMHECTGCSMAKAVKKGIARETKSRSDKKLGRVFVDLGGRKDVASVGGKHYPMIVKDDFTRRAWMYFLKHKSDAGMAFRSFLASVRADGVPSLVEIVRSDNGGEFFGGEFASVCNELLIKQEFTPAYSPQYNGVAERGLGLIEEAAMAARIQAKVLFGHVQLPKTDKLWAEAMHWACEAMNHTACSANPDSKSPYEMWYGEPRPARPYPFLKPAYCRWQRPSKLLPKGESCFYVGPSRDHPRDCHRVLTRAGTIQETRDVTWEVLPSRLPPLQPSLPIEVAEEGGEDSDDDVEDEVWPLVGRGVAHTLLKREAVPPGTEVVEVESVEAGSADPSPSVPSSPSEPSSPANPSVSSPVPEIDVNSGEIETGDPGGDDEVESMGQGGQDEEELNGSGRPVETEASPPTGRRPRHVAELADFNTAARENDEVREGRTRAQTRAVNQQSVPGLMATIGPISGTEVLYALLSEQRAGDETESPKEVVQDVESEPGSYEEAQRTFTLAVKVPIGCNVIDARWVFKWKADETGKIVKAKARLVAKGFKQKYGVDYLETFSPTANAASFRLVVALACKYNLELLHWDIEQAFVQSELDHEVFMKMPPGCGSMSEKVVCLNKS
ncbi:unnamed protein product [Ectocarpus sp. CCAP 1310/34]|nr:unnamed protein product [Ectocarpus sp. CCAP 1310/34]